jgi:hypothetical protein
MSPFVHEILIDGDRGKGESFRQKALKYAAWSGLLGIRTSTVVISSLFTIIVNIAKM